MADSIWLEIGWDKNKERIEALRRQCGVRRNEDAQWVSSVAADTVRHFALGIGDGNLRWFGARPTAAAVGDAPPSFLFAASPTLAGVDCPVADGWRWRSVAWRWHAPLTVGTAIVTSICVEAVDAQPNPNGDTVYQIRYSAEFHDAEKALLAEAELRIVSAPAGAYASSPGPQFPVRRYDLDEIVDIYSVYATEAPRGASPLFWDDVTAGQKLPAMAKGPLTASSTIAFLQGIGGFAASNRLAWQAAQLRPYDAPDNALGVPEMQDRVHWDSAFARGLGLPGATPPACARSCWLIQQITDWMGDGGILRAAHCEIDSDDSEGEALMIEAHVAAVYVEDGKHLTRVVQTAIRRDLSVSAIGGAIVQLPVRKIAP